MPAAPVAANLLAIVWAQGQTQKLIERSFELLEISLNQNKEIIRRKVEARSSRWIPRWVDGIVADKAIAAITITLAEMRDPAHPWRIELKTAIEGLIGRLSSDPELRASVEAAKAELIRDPLFRHQISSLMDRNRKSAALRSFRLFGTDRGRRRAGARGFRRLAARR